MGIGSHHQEFDTRRTLIGITPALLTLIAGVVGTNSANIPIPKAKCDTVIPAICPACVNYSVDNVDYSCHQLTGPNHYICITDPSQMCVANAAPSVTCTGHIHFGSDCLGTGTNTPCPFKYESCFAPVVGGGRTD